MLWNWELPNWPTFHYDPDPIFSLEKQFLLGIGSASAYLKTIDPEEYNHFMVEILSTEGVENSKIEGEILNRDSLQSSIKRHFGLPTTSKQGTEKEANMATLLCSVYESFDQPLTKIMLCQWHAILFKDTTMITDCEKYRTHIEPMQIVSHRYDSPKVFFEAPPSSRIPHEMEEFIHWFNRTGNSHSILERAALAHIYFESIHPFEDGNGRIGRILVEKILSQGIGRPILLALSKTLEKHKKEYYAALETCNHSLSIQHWIEFFANMILEAHEEAMNLLSFLLKKSKMMNALFAQLNPRQTKVLLRMFAEGPQGFVGGLNAEKYIAITKTTRATATRDLTDLVEKGALVKIGELRYTRYRLNL